MFVSILSPDEEYTGDVHGRRYIVEPRCMPSPTRLVWAGRAGIEESPRESSILGAVVALVYRGVRRPGSLWSLCYGSKLSSCIPVT